jgi:hypothetical protein
MAKKGTKITTDAYGQATRRPPRVPPYPEDREAIQRKYEALGRVPGLPVGPVRAGAGGGAVQVYEHGAIFCKVAPDAFRVYGAIYDKYMELGGEGGILGYPVSDEWNAADGVGRFSDFEHGSIYWHPRLGRAAFEIHGAIRERWDSLGTVTSYLGYPTSDEMDWPQLGKPGARISLLEGGAIGWSPETGPVEMPNWVSFRETLKTRSAVSGRHEVAISTRGDWLFRGKWRNSGFVEVNCVLAVAMKAAAKDGSAIGFLVEGDPDGTLVPDPDRNFAWEQRGRDERIRQSFAELASAGIVSRFDADVTAAEVVKLVLLPVTGVLMLGFVIANAKIPFKGCPGVLRPGGTDPLTGQERPPEWSYPIVPRGEPCPTN